MPDDERLRRIAELQTALDRLAGELQLARGELQQLRDDVRAAPPVVDSAFTATVDAARSTAAGTDAPPGEPPPRAAPSPRPAARGVTRDTSSADLERFVGRYGALALGALTLVIGVGSLVSWAITHDKLGPRTRVALGALLTATLAAIGWRLRARSPRYGNTLLALSVALLQVVAWGAGPALGLVSPDVAFAVADAGSLALAALALRERSESLFVVGFGSALIAPFVMSTGTPRLGLLGLYGLLMMAGALRAMSAQPWRLGTMVCIVGTVLYAGALSTYAGDITALHHLAGAVFALVVAALSLQWPREPDRPAVGIVAVSFAALACVVGGNALVSTSFAALGETPVRLAVHIAGAAMALAVARSIPGEDVSAGWLAAVVIVPMLFVDDPFNAVPYHREVSASLRLLWAALYLGAAWFDRGARRGARRGALVGWLGLLTSWSLALVVHGNARPVALALHALVFAYVTQHTRLRGALVPAIVSLAVAYVTALGAIVARGYSSAPLLGVSSLATAFVVAASFGAVHVVARARDVLWPDEARRTRDVAVGLAAFLAFWWGAVELSLAYNRDRSTFLLVLYLAACGVALISRGRVRASQRLRQLGLAVAVCAALYALLAASEVGQIGLRVGSYLAVGAFLLGVAWWYRGEAPASD